MRKKICHHPGCNNLIPTSERYCAQHKREPAPLFSNAVRYKYDELYHTTQWRKLCDKVLREQPHCSKCGSTNNLQVHHIIPHRGNEELFFNENNLTVVYAACHRILTNREIGKRQRKIK
jgi:5-methylcytosine-specific restriction protein A